MPDLDYILYDTAPFNTVAQTEFQLFKVIQGSDATHTENFTNMRGAGSLPNSEKMVVKKISVILDSVSTVIADLSKIPVSSFLDIRVNDQSLFKTPIAPLFNASAYSGAYTLAAGANAQVIGLMGDGYELEIPIQIPPSTSFYVRVMQGTALSAQYNLKVLLHGIYTLPS